MKNKEGRRGGPAEKVNLHKTSEVREYTKRMSRGEGLPAEETAGAKSLGEERLRSKGWGYFVRKFTTEVAGPPTWQEEVSNTRRQKGLRRGRDGWLSSDGVSSPHGSPPRLWAGSEAPPPPNPTSLKGPHLAEQAHRPGTSSSWLWSVLSH